MIFGEPKKFNYFPETICLLGKEGEVGGGLLKYFIQVPYLVAPDFKATYNVIAIGPTRFI